jgi:hypothetical protein
MTANLEDTTPLEEPLAELERELISAYVAGAGQNLEALRTRNDEEARRLLADASLYATARLTEVESRSHYLRSLRGQA